MEREQILKTVQIAIQEQVGDEYHRNIPLPKSTDVLLHIGLDSFDIMELVMKMEQEFGIEIPDEEWATIAEQAGTSTVDDFVTLIASKL